MRSFDFKIMIEETVEDVVQKHRFLASCLDTWGKDRIGCHIYVLFSMMKKKMDTIAEWRMSTAVLWYFMYQIAERLWV